MAMFTFLHCRKMLAGEGMAGDLFISHPSATWQGPRTLDMSGDGDVLNSRNTRQMVQDLLRGIVESVGLTSAQPPS